MHLHIKHNENGPTFRIPVSAEEFVKDAIAIKPGRLPEPEPEDHEEWYDRIHAFDEENHIPETYK